MTFTLRERNRLDKFLSIVLCVIFFFCLALFSFDALFFQMRIEGSSMEPTYSADGSDIVVVARYYVLNRSDIVIIRTDTSDIVKRVVAKGGDVLSLVKRSDSQYCYYRVNGEVIDESYIGDNYKDMTLSYFNKFCNLDGVYISIGVEETTASLNISPNQVFVLGDNRGVSKDSTSHGPFDISSILGKVMFSYKTSPLSA